MSEANKGKARTTRQERLSVAMRENLKRRKAQARGRAASEPKPEAAASHGTGPHKRA
jgi:hypothetical protein